MMQKRSLKELIHTEDPGWPVVQEWIAAARNSVEVLSAERARGEETLLYLQVTTRSPMGAISLETGGILTGDQGISIHPAPFVKEGGPIAERSRRPVPMEELWGLQRDLAAQLLGSSVVIRPDNPT